MVPRPTDPGPSPGQDPDPPSPARVQEIFLAACDLPVEERAAFLASACAGSPALAAEVKALLAFDQTGDGMLDAPLLATAFSLSAAAEDAIIAGETPTEIGPYQIEGTIGQGGMGVVYRAQQLNPRRPVALKVMRPGLSDSSARQRFELETQILGRLQHPGIAQIYEAGTAETTAGARPFFAMELVEGRALTDFAAAGSPTVEEKVQVLAKICKAVHYAHQQGVIHRDLKPGNILVDQDGRPKVLDFGVARIADAESGLTSATGDVQAMIGTLAYMSPEQVSGDPREIDTRTDVYAIGVLAFEFLCDAHPLPLKGLSIAESVRVITENTPATLGAVDRALRGDLEIIVAKALAKEKERRYGSASEMAADLERWLAGEAIVARPASAIYHFQKFASRNRGLVAVTAVVVFVGLPLLTGLGTWIYTHLDEVEAQQVADLMQTGRDHLHNGFFLLYVQGDAEASLTEFQTAERLLEERPHRREYAQALSGSLLALAEEQGAAAGLDELDRYDGPLAGSPSLQRVRVAMLELGGRSEEAAELLDSLGRPTTPLEWSMEGERLFKVAERLDGEAAQRKFEQSRDAFHHATLISPTIQFHDLAGMASAMAKLEHPGPWLRGVLDSFLTSWPDHHLTHFFRAEALGGTGVFKEWRTADQRGASEAAWRRTLEIQPEFAPAWGNLAANLRKQGRLAEAEECCLEAIRLSPQMTAAYAIHREILDELGRHEEALEAAAAGLAIEPDHYGMVQAYSVALMRLGRLEEAETWGRKALAIRPESPHLHASMAQILKLAGKPEEAEAQFRAGISVHPGNMLLHQNFGNSLIDAGRHEEAEEIFRAGLLENPSAAGLRHGLGIALVHLDQGDEAYGHFLRAVELAPDFPGPWYDLGLALGRKGQHEEAIEVFDRFLELQSEDPNGHFSRGNAFQALGRMAEAEASLRRALEWDPGHTKARTNLGILLADSERT